VLHNADFVNGAGSDAGVLWGGLFEVITGLTGIASAICVYPVIKRWGQGRAVGFVASRTLEAAAIFVGVMSVLAVYTLRQDFAGTDAAGLSVTAQGLVAVHNWSFLLGPGVMPAINAILFASILRRSGLVPRWIPTVGLIGAPILLISSTASLFGAWDQISGPATLFALPIATWEFSVGVYMTVKGFKTPASGDSHSTNGSSSVAGVPAMAQ